MADDRDVLRDWHRLFGLLLTDFFTGSPFIVEVERDLSEQQQCLDVVILRRGRIGRRGCMIAGGGTDIGSTQIPRACRRTGKSPGGAAVNSQG